MIQQLAQVLASVMNWKNAGKYEEARFQIRQAYTDLLGLDGNAIHALSAISLKTAISEPEKMKVLMQLLEAEIQVLRDSGGFTQAEALERKILELRHLLSP